LFYLIHNICERRKAALPPNISRFELEEWLDRSEMLESNAVD
jgi:hypothetical protein